MSALQTGSENRPEVLTGHEETMTGIGDHKPADKELQDFHVLNTETFLLCRDQRKRGGGLGKKGALCATGKCQIQNRNFGITQAKVRRPHKNAK